MLWPFSVGATICGCTDPTACGYNPAANIEDGSCDYSLIPVTVHMVNTGDLLLLMAAFGSVC
ncbi:MAG: hypothetical protein SH856_04145 [Flavobacteriales bacterium]|nr:hypothetical protein [Flavobacteriales bacterium]